MQINGQGVQNSSVQRPARSTAIPSLNKRKVTKPGQAINSNNTFSRPKAKRPGNSAFAASPFFKSQSLITLGFVLFMHAAALYVVTRVTDMKMPAVSVPLIASFVLSEPAPEKPKVKPKPKPHALADEPVVSEKPPEEESQPQVIPPQFDVAHLNNPPPDYPPLSRRLREQGEVILRVYVTVEGTAGQVQIHTSSGYPRLDRAAREAVGRWKFMPARRGDETVGAWALVPIQYILKS